MRHGKRLTKAQKLLLHLLAHNPERDNYTVSEAVTIKGISKHLNCGTSYTSYLIKKFEDMGYLSRSKAKIILGTRTKDACFLTKLGLAVAKELEASITKRRKKVK